MLLPLRGWYQNREGGERAECVSPVRFVAVWCCAETTLVGLASPKVGGDETWVELLEWEVQKGDGCERAVDASHVGLALYGAVAGDRETTVGALEGEEPVQHCAAVHYVEGGRVGKCEGENTGICGREVGELLVAPAEAAGGVLQREEGADDTGSFGGGGLADGCERGQTPVVDPWARRVEGRHAARELAEAVGEEGCVGRDIEVRKRAAVAGKDAGDGVGLLG